MSTWPALTDIARDVQSGKSNAQDLVEKSLRLITKHKAFKAIITAIPERARERAKEIDKRVVRGEKVGRLAGVPFIVKDMFLTFGCETTAASNILRGFKAPYQATVIEKLEAEGAICVAKANQDAFGHGTSTENSDFFVSKNPHDSSRVPGGSSGGSAAAVVLEMTPFALGTDTGGSTRQPASMTGCIGYKPTYGLISRSGVIAMASSNDTVGTFARNVADAGLVIDVMAGKDSLDGVTFDRDPKSYFPLKGSLRGKKIGVIKEYMSNELDPGVKAVIEKAVDELAKAGAEVKVISIPTISLALAVYYILVPAEISSNLSRYDGQRFGYIAKDAHTLDETYIESRGDGFGKEAKRRIMIGTYVLSHGYYDAYYKKAQVVRTKLINEFKNAFDSVDFLAGPVAPTAAFKLGENTNDPLKMYLQDIMSVAINLVGAPAISIPAGLTKGMPVGLQLIAPQKHDRQLLELAQAAEAVL